MSPLPDVTVTVQDGALGLITALADQTQAKIGFCSKGNPALVYSFSDITALVNTLGYGQGAEAAAEALKVSGGPVLVVPINEARLALNGSSGFTAGTSGSVTQTGSGPALTTPAKSAVTSSGTSPPAVTLTGTPTRYIDLRVVIVVGGARGTATFKYSLDGGTTYSATIATAATYLMAGTGVTLNFATGTDYTDDNVYTAKTSTPYDKYEVEVEIMADGALGTSTFRYALDASNPAGPTWSAEIVTPTSGLYAIPEAGIAITFASGSYVEETTYTWTTTAPSYNATDVTDVMNVLLADSREWGLVHLVGQASSVGGSATMYSLLDTLLEGAATAYRPAFGLLEVADDTDSNILSAFASVTSKRVSPCAGFVRQTSRLSGRSMKRSVAWSIAARTSKVSVGTDIADVAEGALPGVTYLHRDEGVTPGLDAAGFSTVRTIVGLTGFYPTNGRFRAPPGSDYQYFQYRRVMDRAAKVSRNALLRYLNGKVLTNANGTIYEIDAREIEADVKAKLNAVLVPNDASGVGITIDRTNNVASTNTLNAEVRVTSLGYAKTIVENLGFAKPQ